MHARTESMMQMPKMLQYDGLGFCLVEEPHCCTTTSSESAQGPTGTYYVLYRYELTI